MESESAEHWKEKCNELEQIIKNLSSHCSKVVEKHEELLSKYEKNEKQYDDLLTKFKDRGQQIKKAKDVLIPVANEYNLLRDKYEAAIQCQYEAENFATKINSENKKLKRQSTMLFQKMNLDLKMNEINIDDDDDQQSSAAETDYIQNLNQKIAELEEEKSKLCLQVKQLNEDYHIEKDKNVLKKRKIEVYQKELQQTKDALLFQEKAYNQLAETSAEAVQEHTILQKDLEEQIIEKVAAVKVAKHLNAERLAAQRQSSMLLQPIAGEKRLMEAMIQVEELTTELETLKSDKDQEIQSLKEELSNSSNSNKLLEIENEKEKLALSCDALQQQLIDSGKITEDLRAQYQTLADKYSVLEQKYEKATAPPPPPPPPPLPQIKTGGFFSRIRGNAKKKEEMIQKKLNKAQAGENENYSKAIDEMMKRIREGTALKNPTMKRQHRTQSCPEEDEPSAMQELQGILTKMKKARSVDDLSTFDDDEPTIDQNTELGQAFKKKLQNNQGENAVPVKPSPRPRKHSTIKEES